MIIPEDVSLYNELPAYSLFARTPQGSRMVGMSQTSPSDAFLSAYF